MNTYIGYKNVHEIKPIAELTKVIQETLPKICQEGCRVIERIDHIYEGGVADFTENCFRIAKELELLESQVGTQRKKGYDLDLENKVNCQKEYIVLLEEYNNKL